MGKVYVLRDHTELGGEVRCRKSRTRGGWVCIDPGCVAELPIPAGKLCFEPIDPSTGSWFCLKHGKERIIREEA